jgi:hypothetical protein
VSLAVRYCACGARLARDNRDGRCSPCQATSRLGRVQLGRSAVAPSDGGLSVDTGVGLPDSVALSDVVMRSQKTERSALSRAMRTQGKTWVEIAQLFRLRYKVNARVAFRYAHCLSQSQAARMWCDRWPDDPTTYKNISYWEVWPTGSWREPSLTMLSRLAELYQCGVSDLVADLPDYRLDDGTFAGMGVAVVAPVVELPGRLGYQAPLTALEAVGVQVTVRSGVAVTVVGQEGDAGAVVVVAGAVRVLIQIPAADAVPAVPAAAGERDGGARIYSLQGRA